MKWCLGLCILSAQEGKPEEPEHEPTRGVIFQVHISMNRKSGVSRRWVL